MFHLETAANEKQRKKICQQLPTLKGKTL